MVCEKHRLVIQYPVHLKQKLNYKTFTLICTKQTNKQTITNKSVIINRPWVTVKASDIIPVDIRTAFIEFLASRCPENNNNQS